MVDLAWGDFGARDGQIEGDGIVVFLEDPPAAAGKIGMANGQGEADGVGERDVLGKADGVESHFARGQWG